ncbi:MAG: ABC transporter permease subunit [Candidatus Leucobacter sulfamidivorax]|nr:ABC transporter permease subunit [Candidatus Leucobacter sulfamidivorax]
MTAIDPVAAAERPRSRGGSNRARGRSGRISMPRLIAERIGLVLLVLVAWEVTARVLDARAIPGVVAVWEAALTTVPTPAFWAALGATLAGWALGMLIAAAIGIPAGMLIGASTIATTMSQGIVDFLRTVPAIMLVPLVVLLMGSTLEMKVTLIVIASVWPILIHARYAIGHVDPVARDSVGVFRVRAVDRVAFLFIPSAAPLVATGIRVAATVALMVAIGTEIVTSAPGIGQQILLAQANSNPARAFVFVLLSGLLGVVINLAFAALERRAMFWHAANRRES